MDLELQCPHCTEWVVVRQVDLNCRIFRHGAYRHNLQPMNPHATKEQCNDLASRALVYGCAKPFQVLDGPLPGQYVTAVCDYI